MSMTNMSLKTFFRCILCVCVESSTSPTSSSGAAVCFAPPDRRHVERDVGRRRPRDEGAVEGGGLAERRRTLLPLGAALQPDVPRR